jgi:hypothetical protein
MRERDLESYLKKEVEKRGGQIRKSNWIGSNFCPDRRILGKCWVELKRPDGKGRLSKGQQNEIKTMREHGEIVYVIDTFQQVDLLMEELYGT